MDMGHAPWKEVFLIMYVVSEAGEETFEAPNKGPEEASCKEGPLH